MNTENTPETVVALANGRAFHISGRWPKGHVYDQSDQTRKIVLDPNTCSGCAVANVYQSMTNRIGEMGGSLYEGAKRRRENHKEEKGGITLHEVCEFATEKFGGKYYRLRSIEQILSWIVIVGPVAAGFKWRSGMEYPRGVGNWFKRLFGARWACRRGPIMGNHAVSLLGLSDKNDGYVVLENSRGLSYGNKGTARMSWKDLAEALAAGELFCYGIDFPTNKN